MSIAFEAARSVPKAASAVGVAVPSDRFGQGDLPWSFLHDQGFEGKRDQIAVIAEADGPDVIVVGVGESRYYSGR